MKFSCKVFLTVHRRHHPDVRSVILCDSVARGDETVWKSLSDEAYATEDTYIRRELQAALMCSPIALLLRRYVIILSCVYNTPLYNTDTAGGITQVPVRV